MSTVRRSVYVNPIEPGPISFRAGARIETWLDVTFYQQSGNAMTVDLAAQMVLTPRSSPAGAKTYLMPAIDVANGKTRAVIPAGDISDPNGHAAVIYGTVNGEGMMLARGVVYPDDAAEPLVAPVDVIDDVPLLLTRGQDAVININLWADAGKTAGYDVTGASITANIYSAPAGTPLAAFGVTQLDADSVRLTLYAAQVDALPVTSWWTLAIARGGGTTTLAQGTVTTPIVPPS